MSLPIKAAHWSLKFGGLSPFKAYAAMFSVEIFNVSLADSSRNDPVPAEQASFMA